MRVYVESNFVLELVLEQEQDSACWELVRLADESQIELSLPALSIFEPYTTLYRRRRERIELMARVQQELALLGRTKEFTGEASTNTLPALLVQSAQRASVRFAEVQEQLMGCSRILPLTSDVLTSARKLETMHGLELPDAIVLAAVQLDLDANPAESCFLNRNTKDFGDPAVLADLQHRNCKLLGSFVNGLSFVRSKLDVSRH